jgi:hypothetical protein
MGGYVIAFGLGVLVTVTARVWMPWLEGWLRGLGDRLNAKREDK